MLLERINQVWSKCCSTKRPPFSRTGAQVSLIVSGAPRWGTTTLQVEFANTQVLEWKTHQQGLEPWPSASFWSGHSPGTVRMACRWWSPSHRSGDTCSSSGRGQCWPTPVARNTVDVLSTQTEQKVHWDQNLRNEVLRNPDMDMVVYVSLLSAAALLGTLQLLRCEMKDYVLRSDFQCYWRLTPFTPTANVCSQAKKSESETSGHSEPCWHSSSSELELQDCRLKLSAALYFYLSRCGAETERVFLLSEF